MSKAAKIRVGTSHIGHVISVRVVGLKRLKVRLWLTIALLRAAQFVGGEKMVQVEVFDGVDLAEKAEA